MYSCVRGLCTPPSANPQSFTTPLRELLVDEVQSRYLEAFLLNDAKLSPAVVGNVYLWKKVRCPLAAASER